MAWSKFDPNAPPVDPAAAATPAAARRARVLRWLNWVVLAYTAVGFGFIVYWLARGA